MVGRLESAGLIAAPRIMCKTMGILIAGSLVVLTSCGSPSIVTTDTNKKIAATNTISTTSAPSFSPGGPATYYAPFSLSINEGTSCASVYYTTDGTTPTAASMLYTGAFTVSTTTTVNAMGVCPGGKPSGVTSALYTISGAAAPTLSLASGTYKSSISVTISNVTPGAVIYYTTNGAQPTTASPVYSGALNFSSSTNSSTPVTLKAIAVYPGGPASSVTSATYTILSTTTPVQSQNNGASFFGMDVNGLLYGTPWPLVSFGTLRLWDSLTAWSILNPASGSYQWSNLDRQIQLAEGNNAQVLYTFGRTPPWAIPSNVSITGIVRSNGVVTVTTASPHGLYYSSIYAAADQSSILVAGVTDKSFNGTFAITGTPSPTTLTFAQSGTNTSSSLGTVSAVCSGAYAPNGCAEAPANMADWDNFVTAMIDHVGPGTIRYWELWNEANIAQTWRGDPKVLVTMVADARRIIKAIDPKAVILSPSVTVNFETPQECATYDLRCGSAWMARWLALGGATSIDGVAFHGYPSVGEAPEQIQGQTALLQLAMNQNSAGGLPLLDTESSWGKNSDLPNPSDQVAFVGRHLLLEQSSGIQSSTWYAYDGDWGELWSASSGLSAAGDAFQQVTRWLQGATVTQPCAPTSADSTTFSCAYSRPNGYSALAIWNTTGDKTVTVPLSYVQYRDLSGSLIKMSPGSVQISTTPILLETTSAF